MSHLQPNISAQWVTDSQRHDITIGGKLQPCASSHVAPSLLPSYGLRRICSSLPAEPWPLKSFSGQVPVAHNFLSASTILQLIPLLNQTATPPDCHLDPSWNGTNETIPKTIPVWQVLMTSWKFVGIFLRIRSDEINLATSHSQFQNFYNSTTMADGKQMFCTTLGLVTWMIMQMFR